MDKEKIAVLALALCSFSVLTFAQGVTVNEVKIEPYGSGKLKIEWKSIAGEFIAFYSIRRDGVIVGKAFSPPFIDSDLENGKEYEYVVEAVGTNGDTAAISDPVKAVALEKFTGCESAEINCFDGF
ncbi:MAG TPA: hypothetical protein VJI67_01895, partial [archaeon]|nr:hypothetical protein [archaeon]